MDSGDHVIQAFTSIMFQFWKSIRVWGTRNKPQFDTKTAKSPVRVCMPSVFGPPPPIAINSLTKHLGRGPKTPVCSSLSLQEYALSCLLRLSCLADQSFDARLNKCLPDCIHLKPIRGVSGNPVLSAFCVTLHVLATSASVSAYWGAVESCRSRSPARMLEYSYALDSGGKVPLAAQRSINGCMGSSSAGLSISRAVAVRTK